MAYGLNIMPEGGHFPKVDWDRKAALGGPALKPETEWDKVSAGVKGVPIDGSKFPKQVRWLEDKDNPPPDFDKTPYWNVSDRARQVIEQLEPGVHQFFPVEYVNRPGTHIGDRFWFVVCNRLDAVDPEHSNMVLTPSEKWIGPRQALAMGLEIPAKIDVEMPSKTVFNHEAIGTVHFWREAKLSGGPWLSDEAAAAIRAAGLTGVRLDEKDRIGEV